jgi:hypothetical protein
MQTGDKRLANLPELIDLERRALFVDEHSPSSASASF